MNRLGIDDRLVAAVTEALSGCGLSLRGSGSQEWQLSMARRRGIARIDDGWLVLEFPPARGRTPSPLRTLERNAELSGSAKHVLLTDGSLRLRAEVPADEPPGPEAAGLAPQIREAVAGLASAMRASMPRTSSANETPSDSGAEEGAPSSDPCTLCGEAGWSYSERSSGRLHVDLDVPGGAFYQAAVRRTGGQIVQRVELFADGEAATESLVGPAIAALLLSVSAVVRLVRAVSWRSDAGPAWGFEVQLPGTTTVGAFVHGLSALSVACGLCGREVRALAQDPVLGRRYLEIRHRRLMPKGRALRRRSGAAQAAAS
ncbi:MAG: hypothetical protein GTO46_03540 [Gemmatimonadetes bacterium]|nr:hypothetical protein [Gemmatimonadota bacterium]NIO32873.1 hypothetical protein [Gemmatimonadota bacterium]